MGRGKGKRGKYFVTHLRIISNRARLCPWRRQWGVSTPINFRVWAEGASILRRALSIIPTLYNINIDINPSLQPFLTPSTLY